MFVEGVLFLMKRKVKKGVKMLTSLLDGAVTYDAKDVMATSSPTSAPKVEIVVAQVSTLDPAVQ